MGYTDKDYGEYTGTWIPAIIMLNTKLKPMEKMLYAEVASFRQCFASNKFLADRLGISERTVQTGIAKLKDLKLITVFETDKHQRICVAATQNLHPPTQKLRTTHAEIAIKNKDKNKEEKKAHTSSLREDDSVPVSLQATSSAGAGNKDGSETSAARTEHLIRVFQALSKILHPGQSIMFTAGRKSHLNARLKNFKPSELVSAAKNLMESSWHTGNNPTNKKYASYDFLMRNDEMVEKWLNEKPVSKPKSVF